MTAKAESYSNGEHKDDATTMMDDAKTMLNDGLADASQAAEALSRDAQREIQKVADGSAQFVRENPGVALVGALGVGVLVGLALRAK